MFVGKLSPLRARLFRPKYQNCRRYCGKNHAADKNLKHTPPYSGYGKLSIRILVSSRRSGESHPFAHSAIAVEILIR